MSPLPFTSETFDLLAETIVTLAREVGLRPPRLDQALAEMTSFGRARALDRVLLGAELVPLVAGRA